MYKIEYIHMNLNSAPATVACLIEYVNSHACFSCMAFETFDAAMAVITNAADWIAEYQMKWEKEIRIQKSDPILHIKRVNGKDGKSVSLLRGGQDFITWSIYEDKVSSGRATIIFLDKDGFRCTYEFDTLSDMFCCIKKDRYLAANKQILLVADEDIPIYSSLLFQPDMNPNKKRNRTHTRIVFRGEDGVRQTLECDSVEELFRCIRVNKQLNEKAEILLVASNGALAYSSLASQGELKKKAGLEEIVNWFSDSPVNDG